MSEKYIVVKTINSMLDANCKHPCGVCMCSDNDGRPFFTEVEPFALFDTYEDALTVVEKEVQKMLNGIQEDVASGWSIKSYCNFLYECYKDEACESGCVCLEDKVWLFDIDIQKIPAGK